MSTFQFKSESELLNSFRPKERKKVVLPQRTSFPLSVEYYLTWTDPDGLYVYLIFQDKQWDKPVGVVFSSNQKGSYRSTTRLCNWCHAYGPSDQIGMLTMKPDSRTTVGTLLCLDLSCIQKIEALTGATKKDFFKLSEELCERISFFIERNALGRRGQEPDDEGEDSELFNS